jgi:toxin HigB-1
LDIGFLNEKDQALFQNAKRVKAKYGAPAATRLLERLDDIQAAVCMEDLRHLPGKWEELAADRRGEFSCRLHGGLRLIVRPLKKPPPTKADGGLDWRAIDGLVFIEVIDYHD